MTTIGEAFIRIRPLTTGFEQEAKASIDKAIGFGAGPSSSAAKKVISETDQEAGKLTKTMEGLGSSSGGAKKAVSETESEAGKLKKTFTGLGSVSDDLAKTKLGGISHAAGDAGNLLKNLGKSAGDTATGIGGPAVAAFAGLGIVLAAEIGFLTKGVAAFESQTKAVLDFQRVAGGTAEEDSRLVATMQALGVEPERTARGFKILSTTIEQHGEKLGALGIGVARTKSGQVDLAGTLLNVGDAYRATADPAQRLNIVTTAFGRSGIALIPVLAQTRDRLQQLNEEAAKEHLVFSEKDLQAGENLRIKTKQLSEEFKGLEIEAAHGLIPAITGITDVFLKLLQVGDKVLGFLGKATYAARILDDIGSVVGKVARGLGLVDDSATKAAKAQELLAQQSRDAIESNKELAAAADAVGKASASQVEDTFAVTSAQRSLRDANEAVAESARHIADAEQDVADKQAGIAKAQRESVVAGRDLGRAQDAYNKLVAVGGADVEALAAATRKLRDAQQSLADSQNSVLDAQDELLNKQDEANAALGEFGPKSKENRNAQTALRDSTLKLSDAQNSVLDAQDSIAGAQKDAADAAAGSVASQKRLSDAADTLANAQQHQADTTEAVTKAQRDLVDAQQKLTDTQKQVPDLLGAQEQAYYKLATAQAKQAEDQARAKGATDNMIDSNALLKSSLGDLAGTLAPDSPLRTFLDDTGRQIFTLAQSLAIAQGLSLHGAIGEFLPQAGGINVGGGLVTRASGGLVSAGQFAVVGEKGPELVRFGKGGNVFDEEDTRAILRPPPPAFVPVSAPAPVLDLSVVADLLRRIIGELGRPNVSVGPITNAEVDPLHVASRIAFEFTPPSVAA